MTVGEKKACGQRPLRSLRVVGLDELKDAGWSVARLLDKVIQLDYELYDHPDFEVMGDADQWLPIFKHHPDTWRVLLSEKNELVGYWQTAVLLAEVYSKVKHGIISESDFQTNHYESLEVPGIYDLYFVSTCIHPTFRDSETRMMLIDSFFSVLDRLANNGIFFNEITATAFSEEGTQLCKSFRLSYRRPHSKRLIERYQNAAISGRIADVKEAGTRISAR
jgi:hypothetical protein